MRDDLVIIGGLVLLMLSTKRERIPWGTGWHWPVQDLLQPYDPAHPGEIDYPAVITQEFRRAVPGTADHLGVDIAYERFRVDDKPEYTGHDSSGRYFAPSTTPILAARDGVVWSVGPSPRGLSIVIDHGAPFAGFYQHLSSTVLPAHVGGRRSGGGEAVRVKAGDVIGAMGYDPIDPGGFRHLHFAVWYKGAGDAASVDPTDMLRDAKRSTWRR